MMPSRKQVRPLALIPIFLASPSPFRFPALLVAAIVLFGVVPRLGQRDNEREHEVLNKSIATTVEKLSLCMSAGMNVGDSLDFILDSLPADARRDLEPVLAQYKLGAPLNVCLRSLGNQKARWRPICEALIGAIMTGGSIRSHLDDLIFAVNSNSHFETLKRIRSVAVKASVPLGICFLPAFLLLAIVPLVAGLFTSPTF